MILCFGEYELDRAAVELRYRGLSVPVEPQVFRILSLLIEQRERMVSREEIIERIWGGRFISDTAISSRIKAARRAVGDDGKAQALIRTVHGAGFRFIGQITTKAPPSAGPALSIADTSIGVPNKVLTKPSIAVLPFQPLSPDPRGQMLAQALPHDLITALSRLSWLKVIARGSTFHFPTGGQQKSAAARALGARYELGGAILSSDRSLKIMVELIDADSEAIIWADTLTGSIYDIHSLRNEIAQRACHATELSVPNFEAELARLKVPSTLDAWEAFHLGLAHMYRFNAADNQLATAMFRRALALAPDFARAHAGLSFSYFQNAFMRYPGTDLRADTMGARISAERALELDAKDAFANFTMGRSYWLEGDLRRSLSWLDRATLLNPNFAQGQYASGWARTLLSEVDAGSDAIEEAIGLSPMDPLLYGMLATKAFSALLKGDHRAAAHWASKATDSPGAHGLISLIAVAANALVGNERTAAAAADQARARQPQIDRRHFSKAFPFADQKVRASLDAQLARFGF